MNDSDVDPTPTPREPVVRSAGSEAGCVVACGLALLPLLYVGSFAYLSVDAWNQWGVFDSLDKRTVDILSYFYWPLIWLCRKAVGL